MPKQKGLPLSRRMRHDQHFVEDLTSRGHQPIGRMIPLDKLDPNPGQPRGEVGDLSDIVSSIKEKGVLEPLLVSPRGDRFQIIAGERRFRASILAGLSQIPCIEIDADERGILEISLIENLQRKDLTLFEEAKGIHSLCQRFGYTHAQAAKKLGRARTSITESLSLLNLPANIRTRCEKNKITAKSMLLQISRQGNIAEMEALLEKILSSGLNREEVRKARKGNGGVGRPKNYVYHFRPPDRSFSFRLFFRKPEVEKSEIITVLKRMLAEIEASPDKNT
ncbi:MAG: ParB/RepB/Spo0J family partition protein [Acidobacteria bacterium]|nr:ParB/RepB/Spo0J family partition protein [Acidobacteriota bacterium]